MVLIFVILLLFSIVWILVWSWFFKEDNVISVKKFNKIVDKALLQGDNKKAKEYLIQLLNVNSNPDDKYKLGIAHFNMKEFDEAKDYFAAFLKSFPKDSNSLFYMAQIFQIQKKYSEALEIYDNLITANEKNFECLFNIGKIYYEQKNYNKALEFLEKAKEILPEDVNVLFYIIKCKSLLLDMQNSDEYSEILNEYSKLTNRQNLPEDFYISLAQTYAKDGQLRQSFEYCKKAIQVNEGDVEAYKILGLIQMVNKDFAGAKGNLSIALNLQSNNMETHNLFSYLLCSMQTNCSLKKCREKYYELIKERIKTIV